MFALVLCCVMAQAQSAPKVLSVTKLSSAPVRQSVGAGGPINRLALSVSGISGAQVEVECRYADGLRYRCKAHTPGPSAAEPRRLEVEIPDLDRGADVTLRITTALGIAEQNLRLVNPPQTLHEIESLALPEGGETTAGPEGAPEPVKTFRTWRTRTAPALVLDMPYLPERCDALYAQWVAASATDPVFSSAFGALHGAIEELRPVAAGSAVEKDNLPTWLITYRGTAERVRFIAHYEVVYRVGVCADRVIR